MKTSFRRARPDDAGQMVELMREYYAHDALPFDEQEARSALAQLLEHPELGLAWLITVDNSLAGYVVLCLGFSLEYHGRDAFLDEIYLRPEFRGRGIGPFALEHLKLTCHELQVRALHLEVERRNRKAADFYRRHGFRDNDRQLLTRRFPADRE